jgi:hypothetical protein
MVLNFSGFVMMNKMRRCFSGYEAVNVVNGYQHFGQTCCLFVHFHKEEESTWCHDPKGENVQELSKISRTCDAIWSKTNFWPPSPAK